MTTPTTVPTVSGPTPEPPRRGGLRNRVAAGVLAGALVIGGGAFALTQLGPDASSSATTAQGQQAPGGAQGGGPGGGPGRGAAPVSGTITAISTSSVTVRTSSGTSATYQLADGVVVENDGATATVSDLAAGDQVVLLTGAGPNASSSSSASDDAVSRILAGSSATRGPGGQNGQAPGGTAPGGQNGTAATAASATTV